MQHRRTAGVLFSGCLVYVIMAACSGTENAKVFGSSGASGGSSGGGGAGGATTTAPKDSGLMDVLTDPVPEADANPTTGSRLKAKFLLGDDGSKEYVQTGLNIPQAAPVVHTVFRDTQRQEDCIYRPAADGKTRCVPSGYDTQAWPTFADAACTQQIGWFSQITGGPSCSFTPPKYVLTVDPNSFCPGAILPVHAFPVGQQLFNVGGFYYLIDGQCQQSGIQGSIQPVFELGPEVDPTELVAATEMIEP